MSLHRERGRKKLWLRELGEQTGSTLAWVVRLAFRLSPSQPEPIIRLARYSADFDDGSGISRLDL